MMKVKIPFLPRFKEPMLSGQKTMTSRTKIYGGKGDTFDAFGATFELESVYAQPFIVIREQWKAEGCNSKKDFLATWRKIHPRKTFTLHELLFVHRFHKIKEGDKT